MKRLLGALLLCSACPPPQAMPDAGEADASTPDRSSRITAAPLGAALSWRTELSRAVESYVIPLGTRGVLVGGGDAPGCHLWATDGTVAGTEVIATLSEDPQRCIMGTGVLFFGARVVQSEAYFLWGNDPGPPGALWRSNGTRAGTRKLAAPGPADSVFGLDDRLLLVIPEPTSKWGLWQYLPVTDQFERLATLGPEAPSIFRHGRAGTRHLFYFGLAGTWESDLTAAGTKPAEPGVPFLFSKAVTQGNRMVGEGRVGNSPGLFVSDGTAAGTQLVTNDFYDAGTLFFTDAPVLSGNRVLFAQVLAGPTGPLRLAADVFALEPGQTTPTPLFSSTTSVLERWFFPRDGGAVFSARRDFGAADLFFTDGTPGAPTRIAQLPALPERLLEVGPRYVLQAIAPYSNFDRAYQVWASDGADGGELLLPTPSPSALLATDAGVRIFDGTSLWSTDLTRAGTRPLFNFWSAPPPALLHAGEFACAITSERLVLSLWCTTGAAAGTAEVATLTSSPATFTEPIPFAGVDRVGVIDRTDLVVTNGTRAGTRRYPLPPTAGLEGVLYLDAQGALVAAGGQSFVVDLSTGATTPVVAGVLTRWGAVVSGQRVVTAVGNTLIAIAVPSGAFAAIAGAPPAVNGYGLVSDGTTAYFAEPFPSDGGPVGLWSTDGVTAKRLGAVAGADRLRPHRGELYVTAFSPTENVVTRVSATRVPREVYRQPIVGFDYGLSLSSAGPLLAIGNAQEVQLHDPRDDRTWSPLARFGKATLAPNGRDEAGFALATTGTDGGGALFFYDALTDTATAALGPAPRRPQGLAELNGRTVFWARDPLGWVLWGGAHD